MLSGAGKVIDPVERVNSVGGFFREEFVEVVVIVKIVFRGCRFFRKRQLKGEAQNVFATPQEIDKQACYP